ncbi:hypothetical protein TeGR_g381, partial [Tetraparma gracilis]
MGAACSAVPADGSVRLSQSQKIEYLKKTPFFLYLDESLLIQFADCFTKNKKIPAGEKVPVAVNDIYVVASGDIEITTTLPSENKNSGNTKGYLCNKVAGDIINKGQSQKDAKRKVSHAKLGTFVSVDDLQITTRTEALLLGSDPALFEAFVDAHPEIKTSIDLITKSNIADSLKPLPFLKDIKATQLQLLAAMCRYEAFDTNTNIFNQGDSGDKLYMVLEGSCDVHSTKDIDAIAQGDRRFRKSFHKTMNGELFSGEKKTGGTDTADTADTAKESSPRGGSPRDSTDDGEVHLATLKGGSYFGETALM